MGTKRNLAPGGRRATARGRPARAPVVANGTGKLTTAGRARMRLLVDPALLAAASAGLGTTTKSDTVDAALRHAAENAAVLRGITASTGTISDFPYLDT